MRLRALAALGLASLGLAFLAPLAPAQAAPARAPHAYPFKPCSTLSVSTQNPAPGESITVTGVNFTANASVRLVLRSVKPGSTSSGAGASYSLRTVTAGVSGSFSVKVTLPDSITNTGRYYIVAVTGSVSLASCPADPYQLLNVEAAAASSTPVSTAGTSGGGGGLASTGLDIAALLAAAALLVGGGVLINRRGRTASRV